MHSYKALSLSIGEAEVTKCCIRNYLKNTNRQIIFAALLKKKTIWLQKGFLCFCFLHLSSF